MKRTEKSKANSRQKSKANKRQEEQSQQQSKQPKDCDRDKAKHEQKHSKVQLLTQNSGFTEQGKVLGRCKRFFYDPETASSSGASHVPSQLLNIPSPRGMHSRDSGLPHDTRNTVTFLKAYLPEMDHPQFSSRIDGIWHHLLADCDQVIQDFFMEHGRGVRQEPQSSSIQLHVSLKVLEP